MGRSRKVKFIVCATRVCFIARSLKVDKMEWKGQRTEKRLKEWRDSMNKSLSTHNKHLSKNQSFWGKCWIEDCNTGQIVCEYNPPMFEEI